MSENQQILENRNCNNCGVEFEITDKDKEFYEKVSPVFNGEKYYIPYPTHCPDCRQQRRLAWRNERKLYKRKSDLSGNTIVSLYSPDSDYKVYNHKEWWSDQRNPLDYGRNFDFSRNFFEQFEELMKEVPRKTLINQNTENSEYCSNSIGEKDCYLLFIGGENQRCYYVHAAMKCQDCVDCLWSIFSSRCYECVKIENCYNCRFSINIKDCSDSTYIEECVGVKDSCFCKGLRNQQYCILNQQYSKEEYYELLHRIMEDEQLFDDYKKRFEELKRAVPSKYAVIENSYNCSGDDISNSADCWYGFDISDCQNIKYSYDGVNCNDSFDSYLSGSVNKTSSLVYELDSCLDVYKTLFSSIVWQSENVFYSDTCFNCSNCFGCVGLVNKQYCIFNKQYTKEEYEELLPKIIQHMKETGERGEFFPISISPFGYNQTMAQDFFPVTREEAKEKGYKRMDKEYPINIPEGMEKIQAKDIPGSIEDVDDSILNKAVICEVTGRPFRVIKPELEFYRRHGFPLPRRHPDQRHLERLAQRNPRRLFDRKCDNCSKDMKTTYSPDRPEIVYCEGCYNQYIYG